jgi:hypothetical protein
MTSKFKENIWCHKELEDKRKLRYYKEVVNPNLEYQKYLFILTRINNKISIAKIWTNSYELYYETRRWTIPKMLWDEIICHLCDTKRLENEKELSLRVSLGHNFKIFVTIQTFLTPLAIKTMVILEHFS